MKSGVASLEFWEILDSWPMDFPTHALTFRLLVIMLRYVLVYFLFIDSMRSHLGELPVGLAE